MARKRSARHVRVVESAEVLRWDELADRVDYLTGYAPFDDEPDPIEFAGRLYQTQCLQEFQWSGGDVAAIAKCVLYCDRLRIPLAPETKAVLAALARSPRSKTVARELSIVRHAYQLQMRRKDDPINAEDQLKTLRPDELDEIAKRHAQPNVTLAVQRRRVSKLVSGYRKLPVPSDALARALGSKPVKPPRNTLKVRKMR